MKSLIALVIFAAFVSALAAQEVPVEVESISTSKLNDDWTQMEVSLRANRNTSPDARNERFVDDIRVIAYFAYLRDAKEKKFDFYTAEVEVISLEQGKKENVYFFMPGVIVKRDRLSKTPDYYFVALEVNGKVLPLTTNSFSSNLNESSIASFKSMADQQASANQFTLMPSYNAPLGAIGARVDDLATLRIREPSR